MSIDDFHPEGCQCHPCSAGRKAATPTDQRCGRNKEPFPGAIVVCDKPLHHTGSHRADNFQGVPFHWADNPNAPLDQPAPKVSRGPAIWPLVICDMATRDQVGRQRYGTPLQPHNGRDALTDAYAEALDLAVYLRQALYERDGR